MIIALFHVLYLFGKFVYKKYYDKTARIAGINAQCIGERLNIPEEFNNMIDPEGEQNDAHYYAGPKFSPPAYIQRYIAVKEILADNRYNAKLRKVVDFGCSELNFLRYIKNIVGIEEILCVDIDRTTLEIHKKKAEPLFSEYLHNRNRPLTIHLYEGSVTDNDKLLENVDAVICIELIEHLYPDTLTDFPFNIFGYIKPQVAIVTTPNADFNVLFPNFSGFRHIDHKFEWTREQFQDWAENITVRYPEYKVSFQGICYGPEGAEVLGACTQMAVFHREGIKVESCVQGVEGLFKEVATIVYPFWPDNRSDEHKILDEASFYIRTLSMRGEDMAEEVPLQNVLEMLEKFSISLDGLRSILEESQWAVVDRENGPVVLIPPASWSDHTSGQGDDFLSDYDNDWDDEPGPPINYHYNRSEQEYDSERQWNDETWDDEIRIVIPQNSSFNQSHTYMLNRVQSNENWDDPVQIEEIEESHAQRTSVNEVHDISDNASREQELPSDSLSLALDQIDLEELDASAASNVPSVFSSSFIFSSFPSSSRSEDTQQITDRAPMDQQALDDHSIISISTEEASEFGRFQTCMSVSCLSTEPPLLYAHTDQTSSFCNDDSIMEYEDVVSKDDIINSTFHQNDTEENFELSTDGQHFGQSIDLQSRSSVPSHSSNRQDVSHSKEVSNAECCNTLEERNQLDGQYDVDEVTSVMSGSSSASDDQPRFASSPKICTKKVHRDQTSRQSKYLSSNERNDAHLLNINNGSVNHDQISLKNCSLSTGSSESCNISDKWYEDEHNSMYRRDFVRLKGGNDSADKPGDINTSVSDVSMQEINEEDEACSSNFYDDRPSKNLDLRLNESRVFSLGSDTNFSTNIDSKKCHYEHNVPSISPTRGSEKVLAYPCAKERRDAMSLCIEKDNFSDTQAECSLPKEKRKLRETGESVECKPASPADLETPSDSWSPEVMDSGYPNSASAQDMTTPEYDLSSIAQDRISDSESPSVAEPPRPGFPEVVEVENGDLANNNRDGEGNNMIAMEVNLQPLLDVIENDLENENDIYALENGFPVWLLRILEMANPADLEGHVQLADPVDRAAAGDAGFENVDQDEGFDSTSSDNDSDGENDMGNVIHGMDDNDNHDIGNETDSSGDSLNDWAAGDT